MKIPKGLEKSMASYYKGTEHTIAGKHYLSDKKETAKSKASSKAKILAKWGNRDGDRGRTGGF
jgi:hypothetical protein